MSNAGAYGIAGILIGAVVAIGITLYEAYQRRQEENQYGHGGGGNRYRSSGPTPKSPEKNPPKQKAVCKKCELPFGGKEIERPDCKIHVFHAACVKEMLKCPVLGCKGKFLSKQQTKESVKPEMFRPRRPLANDLFRPANGSLRSVNDCLSFGAKGKNWTTRSTNPWSYDHRDRSLQRMDSDSDEDYSD